MNDEARAKNTFRSGATGADYYKHPNGKQTNTGRPPHENEMKWIEIVLRAAVQVVAVGGALFLDETGLKESGASEMFWNNAISCILGDT